MTDFVVHTCVPYSRHSAGFRALWKLADEITKLGHDVAIEPLDYRLLGLPGFVPARSPYDLPLVMEWSTEKRAEAVHIYPEIHADTPDVDRVVRWYLNTPIHPTGPNDLIFVWKWELGAYPRLTVDVVEHELFFPKTEPGKGTLFYMGKGHAPPVEWWQQGTSKFIDHTWPATRADLADALRGADLLVSADSYTMLNLEATLCGTPVLLTPTAGVPSESVWGLAGIARNRDELADARRSVELAPVCYGLAQKDIANDVPNMIERCRAHFE